MRSARPIAALRRLALSIALVATTLAFAMPSVGAPAKIPPAPSGSTVIAAGHVPSVCSGTYDAYGSNFGVYWSKTAKQWLSAPRCVPRWGYLEALQSGIVKPKGAYTFTAVPTDGSNSGQYAPEAKAISWQVPGKVVSGCGNADLSCTVVPAAKATAEWQWFEARVSMPRTFFVDSPGSNCAGQHLCAGVSTQAWGWVGVPPAGVAIVRGTVTQDPSCASSCPANPDTGVPGVKVTLTSKQRTYTARTRGDGTYKVEVAPGTYTVTPTKAKTFFAPKSRTVKAASVTNAVDFKACGPSTAGKARLGRALADGGYKLPGGTKFVTDDVAPGCLFHGVTAAVGGGGATVTVTLDAQLGCKKHNVTNAALFKFRQTYTFTFTGVAPGDTKRLKSGDAILEIYAPLGTEGDNFIAIPYMSASVDKYGTASDCDAGWNRPINTQGVSVPVLTFQP